jgi:ADP-ribosylglycohydrolase
MPDPREDQFLGALLGAAIGDALGMPTAGLSRDAVRERFGVIRGFHPRVEPAAAEVAAGEVTEETETVLAIVEGMTTGNGRIDPDIVGPRLVYLAKGESRRWFPASTLAALDEAADSLEFRRPLDEDAPAPVDLLVRGIPVGLLHTVGKPDRAALFADAETVVRLTHGSTVAVAAVAAVAWIVRLAAREEVSPSDWATETASFLGGGAAADRLYDLGQNPPDPSTPKRANGFATEDEALDVLAAAIELAVAAERFEDAVFAAAGGGGPADSLGALAGAFAGARFGSRGIPQGLIDGLGCRIYVSLAAPWFLKAAQRRAGILIDLRPRLGGPRPPLPPSY